MVPSKAIIYQDELDYISRCVLDYPDIETGGDFFGFWTYSGFPVIQYVIGPGRKANHQVAFFNQELDHLEASGKVLRATHGLQHIGQWHSHHRLGLAEPSSHDISTVTRALQLYKLERFFLVIANIRDRSSSINGFLFNHISGREYDHISWVVLEGQSPVRKTFDRKFKSLVHKPMTKKASISGLRKTELDNTPYIQPQYLTDYWLSRKENHIVLKQIIDGLGNEFGEVKAYTDNLDKTVYLEFQHAGQGIRIIFPEKFPHSTPVLWVSGNGNFKNSDTITANWNSAEDIGQSTINYVLVSLDLNKQIKHQP